MTKLDIASSAPANRLETTVEVAAVLNIAGLISAEELASIQLPLMVIAQQRNPFGSHLLDATAHTINSLGTSGKITADEVSEQKKAITHLATYPAVLQEPDLKEVERRQLLSPLLIRAATAVVEDRRLPADLQQELGERSNAYLSPQVAVIKELPVLKDVSYETAGKTASILEAESLAPDLEALKSLKSEDIRTATSVIVRLCELGVLQRSEASHPLSTIVNQFNAIRDREYEEVEMINGRVYFKMGLAAGSVFVSTAALVEYAAVEALKYGYTDATISIGLVGLLPLMLGGMFTSLAAAYSRKYGIRTMLNMDSKPLPESRSKKSLL